MCLDLIPILAIQWWLQACSVLLFEFQKVALKRILGTFFFKFSPNLFRKAVYIDKGWAVTFSWYLPMSSSDFTPALVWWVDYTMKANLWANNPWVESKEEYYSTSIGVKGPFSLSMLFFNIFWGVAVIFFSLTMLFRHFIYIT